MLRSSRWRSFLALLIAGVPLGGCCELRGHQAYDLKISRSPEVQDSTAEMDIVGGSPSAMASVENVSLEEYFRVDSEARASANNHTIQFTPSGSKTKTLSADHPIWDEWLEAGGKRVAVLAYPMGGERLTLPLHACQWEGRSIRLRLEENAIVLVTPKQGEE